MRSALVRFSFPDGRLASVPAGGLLGRLATASLRFEDPRVSEAHALVSLRAGRLWLLGLRGAVEVDGAVVDEVQLKPGQRVRLAEGICLEVESVELPDHTLGLELPDGTLFPLQGEVVSALGPPLQLVAHFADPALARAWPVGGGWRILVTGQRARDLVVGMELQVAGYRLAVREVQPFGAAPTVSRGRLHGALTLTLTFSEARIDRPGRPPVHLSGYDARILGELSEYAEPVPWELAAREIWSGASGSEADAVRLRQSWDKALNRLRQHLASHGIREDLVRSDGRGNVGLNLGPGDGVERGAVK